MHAFVHPASPGHVLDAAEQELFLQGADRELQALDVGRTCLLLALGKLDLLLAKPFIDLSPDRIVEHGQVGVSLGDLADISTGCTLGSDAIGGLVPSRVAVLQNGELVLSGRHFRQVPGEDAIKACGSLIAPATINDLVHSHCLGFPNPHM